MAKKKEVLTPTAEATSTREKEIDEVIATVKKHSEIIEKFRISFQNLETALLNLKDRNRLR